MRRRHRSIRQEAIGPQGASVFAGLGIIFLVVGFGDESPGRFIPLIVGALSFGVGVGNFLHQLQVAFRWFRGDHHRSRE